MASQLDPVQDFDPQDGWSLPAWTYSDPEFFELEKERVFTRAWQVVCHQKDVPAPGDWHTLEYVGESVVAVRGRDQALRATSNVCRRRGSRLVDGTSGCARKLVCPYHAWTYDLEGALTGVQVNTEDAALIGRVQQGMGSRSFTVGPLSEKEVCLRHFCQRMRDIILKVRQERRSAAGWSRR
jgi:phenylpropionate dioxygenase-like ring-hydroxylating dioxygenase large terminal subunit